MLTAKAFALVYPSTVITDSTYPEVFKGLMARSDRWTPSSEVSESCKLSFSSKVLDSKECVLNQKFDFIERLRSGLHFNYDISNESYFQKWTVETAGHSKFRFLLALHPNKKSPLVIFRMGVHGNIDEFFAERYLLKLFHEDLGFHVVAIESATSHSYLKINERINIGPVEEAMQTLYLLNLIKENKLDWSRWVQEVHLSGVSMSGAGAMLATSIDEQSKKWIQSTHVICPLINMEETLKYHFEPSVKNLFLDYWNSMRMKVLIEKDPKLAINFSEMLMDGTPRFVPKLLKKVNESAEFSKPTISVLEFQKEFPNYKFSKAFLDHLQSSQNWSQLNQFWPIFENKKTPIHITYSPNDPIVVNLLNIERIQNKSQKGNFDQTTWAELNGLHCAFASEYQWPFLVEYFKRQFKKN